MDQRGSSSDGSNLLQLMEFPSKLCGANFLAMANDEDHSAFARQLLLGRLPEAVVLTEVSIAGDRPRMTPASLLKGAWIQAPKELDVEIADVGAGENELLFMEQLSGSAAD